MSKPVYPAIESSIKRSTYKVRKAIGLLSTDSVLSSKIGIRVWSKINMRFIVIPDMIINHIVEERVTIMMTGPPITITFEPVY